VVHVGVERARAQGVLYQLQDVSRLADEPAHQPELRVVLVGQHELTMLTSPRRPPLVRGAHQAVVGDLIPIPFVVVLSGLGVEHARCCVPAGS